VRKIAIFQNLEKRFFFQRRPQYISKEMKIEIPGVSISYNETQFDNYSRQLASNKLIIFKNSLKKINKIILINGKRGNEKQYKLI
jgi:hypothetical protein